MPKRLFEPLGMKDTTFWPGESQLSRLAKAYRPGPGGKGKPMQLRVTITQSLHCND